MSKQDYFFCKTLLSVPAISLFIFSRWRQAIIAATKTAAEAIGIDDMVGTIEAGKIADIIAVEGNPLKDITILHEENRIKMVMKEGVVVITR